MRNVRADVSLTWSQAQRVRAILAQNGEAGLLKPFDDAIKLAEYGVIFAGFEDRLEALQKG
jgi:hypothetical protein